MHLPNSCGQRGLKWQPCGPVRQRRRQPGDRRQPLRPRPVDPRDRAQQAPRVRVLRVVEDLVERSLLHDPARVHDRDPVGDVGHHPEVVRHEDDRGAGLVAELAHPLQDLRLDRHVERRGGLVGDQHGRVAGERQRDHHALPHAARELERVIVDPLARARDPNPVEQLHRPLARLLVGKRLVLLDLLDDLGPDLLDRVQRGHRILEDHRDLRAAHPPELVLGGVHELRPLVVRGALEVRVGRAREPHQRHRGHGLAGARLAHHREDLAGRELERHALHGLHHALLGGEGHLQILHRQERLAAGGRAGCRGVGAHCSLIRGSRYAYTMSTIAFSSTMKKAANSVVGEHGWHVELAHSLRGVLPHPLKVEDRLGEDGASAHHRAEVEPPQGDHRDQRVAKDVSHHHLALRQPLRARRSHVVLVDRVENVRSEHARVEPDEQDRQRGPRQDQVIGPVDRVLRELDVPAVREDPSLVAEVVVHQRADPEHRQGDADRARRS